MSRRQLSAILLLPLICACDRGPAKPCESCVLARLENQWCEACRVGYVAGVAMKSKILFECMDAHGHELQLDAIECPECQAAVKVDGFCDHCKTGWINKLAFFSKLTYVLGKGKVHTTESIGCAGCRKNAERYGWCDECKVGMIGNTAVADRKLFGEGSQAFETMLLAVEASPRCESCAMAIVTDTPCHLCKVTYRGGKSTPGVHY
ncbi:hypothetical protein B7486_18875 [cyanobacterium TDX16]|nr:hypothetical protein B7486_18875 [cyanobacterium TDX16]